MNTKRLYAICLSALLSLWAIHLVTNHLRQFGSLQGHTVPAKEGPSAVVRSLRPNYPYSVIAGGAYSPRELQVACRNDKVVREHYANFDLKQAKLVSLTGDTYQYLSYRIKDQIYWTKKKIRMPKGELLLTDGISYARTRCGNRLSGEQQKAGLPHEADLAALSLPPFNPDLWPRLAMASAPVLGDMPAAAATLSPVMTSALAAADKTPFAISGVAMEPLEERPPVLYGALAPGALFLQSGRKIVAPVIPETPIDLISPVEQPVASGVPEPRSIYLFLISLGVSIWGLMRLSGKEESSS